MDNLKQQIIDQFKKEINLLDFDEDIHILEIKYDTIVEKLKNTIKIKKEKYTVPLHQTSNNNNICVKSDFDISSGKIFDTVLNTNNSDNLNLEIIKKTPIKNIQTTIPDDFTLNEDMKQYASLKFIQNVEEEFENFKVYYQSKGTLNNNWEATWKQWVLNHNKYKNHLPRTPISPTFRLNNDLITIAKSYIKKDEVSIVFEQFKAYHIASGNLKASWKHEWKKWCITHKEQQKRQPFFSNSSQIQEKQQYKWDFKKAQDTSNKIKDWLRFEKGVNWLRDYYQKNIPIPGIGWQKVMHPDFDKEEILLYKIDSTDGQFMLNHKSEDIIEIEVLEND